jgi:hypothetical protein
LTISSRAGWTLGLWLVTIVAFARPPDGATFDLVLRSEITINRPAKDVWPHFLDMDVWMTDNTFQDIEGKRGEEGQLRLVTPKESGPYASYYIKTVRARPFEQYVLKVIPQLGDDYLGFADFSFTEQHGKTHLIYDIYVELHLANMSEEQFREFSRQQYERGRLLVNRNNQNLKSLVESGGR